MNRKMERLAKKLAPKIVARLDSLLPEFPPYVKSALVSAELSFRLQGGCANIIEVHTTEDGMFLSPMPEDVQSFEDIESHLQCLVEAKPGVSSASFAYVSVPQGKGRDLICVHLSVLPRFVLHVMEAPIIGPLALGEWSIKKSSFACNGNVMPRVIGALRKFRHAQLHVSTFDCSAEIYLRIDGGEYVNAEINGDNADPEEAIEKIMKMVKANLDGGPVLVVTAIDEGDCPGGQPKAVWGFRLAGSKLAPAFDTSTFSDLATLFALADDE